MKSVIDHLDIVSRTADQMICYLTDVSCGRGNWAAHTRTQAELFRALANYCIEQADAVERRLPLLLRVQQENEELARQEQEQQQTPPTDAL